MGRFWAMGCSASNAASDLADRARRQAFTREALIREIMSRPQQDPLTGEMVHLDYDSAAVAAELAQARATLRVKHADDSPDADRYGAPVAMFVNGEVFETVLTRREKDGRIYREGVAFNGPLMKTIRVREERDGGDFTRVVAEVKG